MVEFPVFTLFYVPLLGTDIFDKDLCEWKRKTVLNLTQSTLKSVLKSKRNM